MIKYIEVLMLIDSLAIFVQGFSFRRRNVSILLISSLIIIFVSGLSIILNGKIVNVLSNVDIYEVTVSVAYVLFWFIFGYIVGGFQRVTAEDTKVMVKVGRREFK